MSEREEEQCLEDMSEDSKQSLNDLMFANKCLNILIEFKSFVDSIFDKIKDNLEENDFSKYNELNDKVNEVYKSERYYSPIVGQNIDVNNGFNRSVFNGSIEESQSYKEEADSHSILIKQELCDNSYCLQLDECMDQSMDNDNSLSNVSLEDMSRERGTTTKASHNYGSVPKKVITKRNNRFECDICDKSFLLKYRLIRHQNSTHFALNKIKIRCEVDGCQREFMKTINYKIHLECHNNNGVVNCPIDGCDEVYDSEKSMLRHIKWHRMKSPLKEKIGCDWPGCEYKDWTDSSIKRHKLMVHTPDEISRTLECNYPGCSKKFKIKHSLNVHEKTHLNNREVICEYCNKTFKNDKILKTHVLRQHILEKKWTCDHPACKFRAVYETGLMMSLLF